MPFWSNYLLGSIILHKKMGHFRVVVDDNDADKVMGYDHLKMRSIIY